MSRTAAKRRPPGRRLLRFALFIAVLALMHAVFTPGHAHVPPFGTDPCAGCAFAPTARTPDRHPVLARRSAVAAHPVAAPAPRGTPPAPASGRDDRHTLPASAPPAAAGALRPVITRHAASGPLRLTASAMAWATGLAPPGPEASSVRGSSTGTLQRSVVRRC